MIPVGCSVVGMVEKSDLQHQIQLPKVPGQIWNMSRDRYPSFFAKCMRAGTKAERRGNSSPCRPARPLAHRPSCAPTMRRPRPSDGHHERAARRRISQGRLRHAGGRSAMTSLAIPFESSHRGVLRWGICFAVVVAAHGAAAVALLHHALSDSGFDAGAPVVMIELPEAPAAFATPPTEVVPGPTEPETEQTPPPKEETKPPEEVAEVALPV